jgi:Zn-dependent M16 (insulinase) family peptidase
MNYKMGKIFELGEEIIAQTIYRDPERLKTVLARHFSQVESQVKGNGYHVASRRLSAYISNQGKFYEITGGLTYYWFISDLLRNFDTNRDTIIGHLEETASLLFTRDNMEVAVTGAAKDFPGFTAGLDDLVRNLPRGKSVPEKWDLAPMAQNEGLMAASNVQYVIQGYNFKKLGYNWNAKMRVLNQVLSTDWLQNQIRVIGGAYGGFCNISPGGNFTFNSYRDPNLDGTLESFSNTPRYLEEFNADAQSMTRYIIRTIAEMDSPLTPSQKGDQAVSLFYSQRTRDEVQRDREEVLSTTREDIREFSKMVADILDQKAFCVYGNAEKLTTGQALFQTLLKIDGSDNL